MSRQIYFYLTNTEEDELVEYIINELNLVYSTGNQMIESIEEYKSMDIGERGFMGYLFLSKDLGKNREIDIKRDIYVIQFIHSIFRKQERTLGLGSLYYKTSYYLEVGFFRKRMEKVRINQEFDQYYEKLCKWIKDKCYLAKRNPPTYISKSFREEYEREKYKIK